MSDYTLVLPNIFIGNAAASKDLQFFKTYKVTHVINLTEKESNYFENHDSINNVKYLHIALSDTCSTNISYHFSQTNKFISMCQYEHYPFEQPLHEIYKSEYCLSPLPSLAVHITNVNSVFGLSPLLVKSVIPPY